MGKAWFNPAELLGIAMVLLALGWLAGVAGQAYAPPGDRTAMIAQGERLSSLLGCKGCHGQDLAGRLNFDEAGFGTLYASNLSRILPSYSDAALDRTLRTGLRPDGSALWEMPSAMFASLDPEEMRALTAYLRSVPPTGRTHPRAVMLAGWRYEARAGLYRSAAERVRDEAGLAPVDLGQDHARGRHLAMTACSECHAARLDGNKAPYRPDLIVAASYSLSEFRTLMRTGRPTGGRTLKLMAEVARDRFSRLTDDEIAALHGYLSARALVP
ncbi:c-type cytochrome [Sphingomonas colocasiae]|uniref:Cytochrome c n=1 Tax=Sphingomonas colocasiae TaxID=1848973 RepID=A0ABS7PT84_9SPHN|nr:c-type cytochrome [Sphingomonas colocasiae]MBY8823184.1 cytochrome c [Sphingomonas colocasiae]